MSDIIFKKNKFKYLFIALLLLVIIIFTGYISTLFIFHPSEYIYWLMPNKLVVFLTGILGALVSLVLLYIMIKSVFNKNFYIRINQEGLYLGIIQYSNKLIYWKDITGVESMEINGIKHILIHIKNIEYYKNKEKGIQKYFFTLNTEKYKTPFAINVTALSDKFDVIMQSIIRNWGKFK
jgi:hypothetical protein